MSPVISTVSGPHTWRARLLIAAVALVAAAGAFFASPGVARADVLYNGQYRSWGTGNCLDSNWNGDAYSIGCNWGNFQNWTINHVATLEGFIFGFNITDDETHRCLDSNGSSVYTWSYCIAGDTNQLWWMIGQDNIHQVWCNASFSDLGNQRCGALWDNGNGTLTIRQVGYPWSLGDGHGIWRPGF
jgi:hypothetical protein